MGGVLYFRTFTDDYSRKTWIYFLKNKSETLEKFGVFKNQTGLRISTLRSDNGGEYRSLHFTRFCEKYGIKRQFSALQTP